MPQRTKDGAGRRRTCRDNIPRVTQALGEDPARCGRQLQGVGAKVHVLEVARLAGGQTVAHWRQKDTTRRLSEGRREGKGTPTRRPRTGNGGERERKEDTHTHIHTRARHEGQQQSSNLVARKGAALLRVGALQAAVLCSLAQSAKEIQIAVCHQRGDGRRLGGACQASKAQCMVVKQPKTRQEGEQEKRQEKKDKARPQGRHPPARQRSACSGAVPWKWRQRRRRVQS